MSGGCHQSTDSQNTGFTTSTIASACEHLGIACVIHNYKELEGLRFCSTFAPEDRGVYFLEPSARLPDDVVESLVVTSSPLNNPTICSLVVDQPQVAFYRLMDHFFAASKGLFGIHQTAIVSPQARVSPSAYIGPYCIVGNAEIMDGTQLMSHVVVNDGTVIGSNVRIESHTTIGATGVAWAWDAATGERVVQPQIGGVVIGSDCFIGTDVSVVRGSVNESTSLGKGCLIAHGSKIGHGAFIGDNVHFANNVSIGGNVRIHDRCFLGSACTLLPGVRIAEGTIVGAGAVASDSIEQAESTVCGVPARKINRKPKHTGVPRCVLTMERSSK
jgi:UDP-3-O-[3-hydroxymyristoyl] glucosamine N-acyltransferase